MNVYQEIKMTVPTSPFPIIDNPHADDTFADQITGFQEHQGVVRMTLEKFRLNFGQGPERPPASRVVIGALCMPTEAAEAMAHGLLRFIDLNRKAVENPTADITGTTDARTLN